MEIPDNQLMSYSALQDMSFQIEHFMLKNKPIDDKPLGSVVDIIPYLRKYLKFEKLKCQKYGVKL